MQVPSMLRWNALILGILIIISILLSQPLKKTSFTTRKTSSLRFMDIIRDKTFLVLLFVWFFADLGRMYSYTAVKIYGSTKGIDDVFLSTTATISNLFSAFGRIFWAFVTDSIGFKRTAVIVYTLNSILFATITIISDNKIAYMAWFIMIFFCNGCTQPLFG